MTHCQTKKPIGIKDDYFGDSLDKYVYAEKEKKNIKKENLDSDSNRDSRDYE